MKIFQPMLFVGLGGTGCLVGAELERRLRDELCGPDGELLHQRSADRGLRPYQLPSCVQFVYADFSEGDMSASATCSRSCSAWRVVMSDPSAANTLVVSAWAAGAAMSTR